MRNDETCLKSLKRLRKELNEDTRTDKNHTAVLLGELRIFRNFLVPLAKTCSTERDDKVLVEATKVAVQLTMPVGSADKGESRAKRVFHLQQFKSELLKPGALQAFMRLIEQPLANSATPSSARKKEDKLVVELLLWFLRNLLAVPDMQLNKSGSSKNAHLLNLHEDFIIMLQKESIFDMILFLGEYVGTENNRDWNFILLEIFYQIFRGAEAEDLFNLVQSGSSNNNTNRASATQENESTENNVSPIGAASDNNKSTDAMDPLKSLHLKMRAKRVQANKALSSRHSRFGGKLKLSGTSSGQGVLSSAFELAGNSVSSMNGSLGAKAGAMNKPNRRKKDTDLAQAHDVHVMGNDVRSITASRRMRRVQRDLCQEMIDRCYGPLFKALKQDFRRDDHRVLQTDHYQFVWLAGLCMAFECRRREKEANLTNLTWRNSPLLATMDVWTFHFLISSCEQHETNKRFRELQNSLRMLSSMVQLLELMLKGEDEEDHAFCVRLRNSVFYDSSHWELVPRYMRQWDPNSSSWLNMAHMATMSTSMLQIMAQMDDERVVVRGKRRGGRQISAADASGGGSKTNAAVRLMGSDWSTDETLALVEVVKQFGDGSAGSFRKALKDETLGPIFDNSRNSSMLFHRWKYVDSIMKEQKLDTITDFIAYEAEHGAPGEDEEAAQVAEQDEEERRMEEHRQRLIAQDTEHELKLDSIVRKFALNSILENLSVLIDPARVPGFVSEAQLMFLQDEVVPKFYTEAARFNNPSALWHIALFGVYVRALREYKNSRPHLCEILRQIISDFFVHAASNRLAFAEILFWRSRAENEQMMWHYEDPDDRRARLRDERRRRREEEKERRRAERRRSKSKYYSDDDDDDDEDNGYESYEEEVEVEEEVSDSENELGEGADGSISKPAKRTVRKVVKKLRKRRKVKGNSRNRLRKADKRHDDADLSSSEGEMEADLDNVGFSGNVKKRRSTPANPGNSAPVWSKEERDVLVDNFAQLLRDFPDSVYKMLSCEAELVENNRSETDIRVMVERLQLHEDVPEAKPFWHEAALTRMMKEVAEKGHVKSLEWIGETIKAERCVLIPQFEEHYTWQDACEELLSKMGWTRPQAFWKISPAAFALVQQHYADTLSAAFPDGLENVAPAQNPNDENTDAHMEEPIKECSYDLLP